MSDLGDDFKAMREFDRKRRERNLRRFNPAGWTRHTEHHYTRDLLGDQIQCWPSRNKFMWRGQVHHGNVAGFIRNREQEHARETNREELSDVS